MIKQKLKRVYKTVVMIINHLLEISKLDDVRLGAGDLVTRNNG